MSLINDNDITTLRRYVRMSFTATPLKSMPDLDAAERKFLIPVLTQPVFDVLQAQVAGNSITWTTLLNLCRAVICPLAVYLDLPFLQASIEDGGLKTTHSDNKQAAHQWEYNKVRDALVEKGMAALEDLIDHLLISGATYNWSNDETKANIFRTGKDLSPRYISLHMPNVTFQYLKPLLNEVEDHFIRASIGDDTFETLRDISNPSAAEKVAMQLIKKCVAQYLLVRAVERMPVKITPHGLMSTLESSDGGEFQSNKTASETSLLRLMQAAQREGDAYHLQLKDHLNKHANATVFATYYNSEYYKAPVEVKEVNDDLKGSVVM